MRISLSLSWVSLFHEFSLTSGFSIPRLEPRLTVAFPIPTVGTTKSIIILPNFNRFNISSTETVDDHSVVKAPRLGLDDRSKTIRPEFRRVTQLQTKKEENRDNLMKKSLDIVDEYSRMSLASLMHDSASLDQPDQSPSSDEMIIHVGNDYVIAKFRMQAKFESHPPNWAFSQKSQSPSTFILVAHPKVRNYVLQ